MTEINVTSPTGIREVRKFGGADVASLLWDAIEKSAKRRISEQAVVRRADATCVTQNSASGLNVGCGICSLNVLVLLCALWQAARGWLLDGA